MEHKKKSLVEINLSTIEDLYVCSILLTMVFIVIFVFLIIMVVFDKN